VCTLHTHQSTRLPLQCGYWLGFRRNATESLSQTSAKKTIFIIISLRSWSFFNSRSALIEQGLWKSFGSHWLRHESLGKTTGSHWLWNIKPPVANCLSLTTRSLAEPLTLAGAAREPSAASWLVVPMLKKPPKPVSRQMASKNSVYIHHKAIRF